MAKINRFEEIQAWKKARELTKAIYEATKVDPFHKDFALRDQVRRAAISVMSNVAEGFARRTDKEFINFLAIAHGSVAELQSQLYVGLDQNYLPQERFDNLYSLAEETSRLIQGFPIIFSRSRGLRLQTHGS